MKALEDILVVDLSQFLSGPSASLRLADMGARVIKVERPETGDICRNLYVSNVEMNGDSSIFHAINRNKESFCADLKKPEDLQLVKQLLTKADVVMHNFRPGVIDRLGLDYETIKSLNPAVIYGEISGYGKSGPWAGKPGQDLLVQSLSGLTSLSGNAGEGPVPVGMAIVDMLAGAHLAQGILAALVRRGVNGAGALVQASMMESILDLQFEMLTTFFQDGGAPTERTASNNAHAYLGAPYGVYQTADGFLALAMGEIPTLGMLLNCSALEDFTDRDSWFTERDDIKMILAKHLEGQSTQYWLDILEPADIWCANVLDWERLRKTEAYQSLQMEQEVKMSDGYTFHTTRCPIRMDGERLFSEKGSPKLGEHTEAIIEDLKLAGLCQE
ncbi:CaiB/BaiF CoA-transferase family protein [Persicobacter diffluens]|uniref:CoA transferase n=1 Tax=Persicobacter diffluens TaxID=981 RepID=A0AAN4W1A6_9BACT|nr:CoA transferase [Persicobacter diffluens]